MVISTDEWSEPDLTDARPAPADPLSVLSSLSEIDRTVLRAIGRSTGTGTVLAAADRSRTTPVVAQVLEPILHDLFGSGPGGTTSSAGPPPPPTFALVPLVEHLAEDPAGPEPEPPGSAPVLLLECTDQPESTQAAVDQLGLLSAHGHHDLVATATVVIHRVHGTGIADAPPHLWEWFTRNCGYCVVVPRTDHPAPLPGGSARWSEMGTGTTLAILEAVAWIARMC